jgi:hypothetical protein
MSLATSPYANRGPIEIASISTALTYTPAIRWVQVISAGSGGLVVKDEGGVARTFTGLLAGQVLAGPFSEITSMTLTKILVGDGPAPEVFPPAVTAALTVDALTTQYTIPVDLSSAILAAGTPMAAWADNAGASAPGITLANSKAVGLRWNNFATQTAVWLSATMPQDVDDAAPIVMHILASKSGATLADATTFTVTAFFQTVGALHDADVDCGGTSSAMTGNATAKTVAELTLTIAAADVPPSPSTLSFSIKPTDALLGTDDLIIEAIWFEATRKLLTA